MRPLAFTAVLFGACGGFEADIQNAIDTSVFNGADRASLGYQFVSLETAYQGSELELTLASCQKHGDVFLVPSGTSESDSATELR